MVSPSDSVASTLMQRMSDMLTRWLDGSARQSRGQEGQEPPSEGQEAPSEEEEDTPEAQAEDQHEELATVTTSDWGNIEVPISEGTSSTPEAAEAQASTSGSKQDRVKKKLEGVRDEMEKQLFGEMSTESSSSDSDASKVVNEKEKESGLSIRDESEQSVLCKNLAKGAKGEDIPP